jgi:1-acyl-sn-glycerol-3-phosphate acyltransferase
MKKENPIFGYTRFMVVFIPILISAAGMVLLQWLMRLLRMRHANRAFAYYSLSWLSRRLYAGQGVKVSVSGLENIPKDKGVLFMSNHQEYSDILLCYGYLGKPMAMVAKKELGRIFGLATFMRSLECYMLDRKNPRQAIELFEKAKRNIVEENYSALIYPEGTRSKGPQNRSFMSGATRIAYLANCPIIPVTINGSWRTAEYLKRFGGDKRVDIVVHAPINVADYPADKKQELIEKVQQVVESGFTAVNNSASQVEA